MPVPEPHVRTWMHVNFDVPTAEGVIAAIDGALTTLSDTQATRTQWRPTDQVWGGPHHDTFAFCYGVLDGKRADIVEELALARGRMETARSDAVAEQGRRQAEWDSWHRWYDTRLTPDERAHIGRRREAVEPADALPRNRSGGLQL